MNWFAWRQSRKTFMIFGVILVTFALFTILTGNHYWHTYQHALANCHAHPTSPECTDLSGTVFQNNGVMQIVEFIVGLFVPLVLGLFVGSPLFSKEYEEGTNKLVWTQSVSRRKWLTTKLIWALGFAALYGLAVALLVTWWARTINALDHDRFKTGLFDVQGLMPIAYSIFYIAVGFTISAWFRKTIVAIGVTIALFIGFQSAFAQWIRPHYMTPVSLSAPLGPNTGDAPQGAWVLNRGIYTKNGQRADDFYYVAPPQCQKLMQQADAEARAGSGVKVIPAPGGGDPIQACLTKAGFHQVTTYQPAYRYWDFQRIETGIFLGMTALAVGATYWLILKRDA